MMRYYPKIFIFVLICSGLLAGCGGVDFESPETSPEMGRLLIFSGKVVYVAENDVWGIVRDDLGTPANYRPTIMPAEFQQADIRVRVVARPVHQTIQTVEWGRVIIVESIERLD